MNSRFSLHKCISIFICVFCTLLSMISLPVMSFVVTTDTVYADDNNNSFDKSDYKDISYSYDGVSSQFSYNDSMLLTNANELSGDLAKVSVALASLAYDRDKIEKCLKSSQMGFTVKFVDNYKKSNYYDNDFVAYMIAHKTITYEGKTYNAYIVPVRGTPSSCEWFSDFNLGKRGDGYHEGFKIAADEVLYSIRSQVNTTNNIFLITGHSRGAAVANIVAGELSQTQDLASADRIFGYTFACPAVKKSRVGNLKNIKNYNNPGDAIVALPLEEWGYKRYGEDITLSTNQSLLDNFKQRFKAEKGKDYKGALSTDAFVAAFKSIASDEEAFHSETNSFLIDIVAWGLSEKSFDVLLEILYEHDVSECFRTSLKDILLNQCVGEIQYRIDEDYRNNLELLANIDIAIETTAAMTEEDFSSWKNNNSSLVEKISEKLGINVTTRRDLVNSRSELEDSMDDYSYIGTNLMTLLNLYYSADESIGTLGERIEHAHEQATYILWINAMYYGYKGWYNYSGTFSGDINFNNTSCIGEEAFYRCTGLAGTLEIPKTIESIGDWAFKDCTGLTKLIVPVDLKFELKHEAIFYGCNKIEELRYTPGKTGVGLNHESGYGYYSSSDGYGYPLRAFLKKITFDEGITKIGEHACSYLFNVETVELPQSLEEIGDNAFFWSESIKNLKLPDNLKKIGDYAFYDCKGLTGTLEIPETLESIGVSAFENCTGLTGTLEIPETLKSIGVSAFENCTGLTGTLKIPETLESIGASAFENCTGLTGTLEIPETLESIGGRAFWYCAGLTKLIVPADIDWGSICDYCYGLEEVRLTPGKTGIVKYYSGNDLSDINSLKKISFDEGITKIEGWVFNEYSNLETVEFPQSLEEIDEYAFNECENIKNLKLPDNTKKIGDWAFARCTGLTELILPVDVEFEGSTFMECNGIEEIRYTPGKTGVLPSRAIEFACGPLKKLTFDEGITKIGDRAFGNAYNYEADNYVCEELETLNLPQSLKKIGEEAFYDCSSLSDVYYQGTKADWKRIKISEGNEPLTDATIHYLGEPPETAAESISLDKQQLVLEKGKTGKLTAVVKPDDTTDKTVTWSSSDTGVAGVDVDGNVTAVNKGTAMITARTSNGKTAECEVLVRDTAVTEGVPGAEYQSKVIGDPNWQEIVRNGAQSGTTGESKIMEAYRIGVYDQTTGKPFDPSVLDVKYRGHIQTYGWESPVTNFSVAGRAGEGKRIEALELSLTGTQAKNYDIYYALHVQTYGWLNWAKNGERAGTASLSKRVEAIKIQIVPKGSAAPGKLGKRDESFIQGSYAKYSSKVIGQDKWLSEVKDGAISGTTGKSLIMEAFKLNATEKVKVFYRGHIQSYGWEKEWKTNGQVSGREGEGKRIEAIEMKLSDADAKKYDIYYCMHVQSIGWLNWAKNGEPAGSSNLSRRVEAIAVRILPKGTPAPGKLGTRTDCYVAGVPATSATLDKTSASMKVGSSLQLKATVKPDNVTLTKHSWSSSDKTVATVDSTGKVTAKKKGKATITFTTQDGRKSAKCTVNVE